jgi:hypothetical protein
MGEDNELLAANTVEQIARRLSFRPEAINQIKTGHCRGLHQRLRTQFQSGPKNLSAFSRRK